jgi:hypothetical protein
MSHTPHPKGPHKFWHIQYERKRGKKWKDKTYIQIYPRIKVYKGNCK